MTRFIRLTLRDRSPIWLNSGQLSGLMPGADGTKVFERGVGEDGYWTVTETPETILALIEGAAGDAGAVTDEMLAAAMQAYQRCGFSSHVCMRAALEAAMKARRP